MTAKEKKVRQMPKGGRKGGAVFPRVTFQDALGYARKLVSKTHVGAQPRDVILSGVVGAKAGIGNVRLSALKQYGFLKGDTKSKFSADELAKQIVAAPPEELRPLYSQAILKPTIFKRLFETFHSDTVTKAKLKQRAADLNVHPEETETCVELYLSGMTIAGLVTVEGDRVTHVCDSSVVPGNFPVGENNIGSLEDIGANDLSEVDFNEGLGPDALASIEEDDRCDANLVSSALSINASRLDPRAVFNVNVTLDSSLDIDKLQKQLELLKRFGAI